MPTDTTTDTGAQSPGDSLLDDIDAAFGKVVLTVENLANEARAAVSGFMTGFFSYFLADEIQDLVQAGELGVAYMAAHPDDWAGAVDAVVQNLELTEKQTFTDLISAGKGDALAQVAVGLSTFNPTPLGTTSTATPPATIPPVTAGDPTTPPPAA